MSTEIESGELDQTMADSSELNSSYEIPLKTEIPKKIPAIIFKIAADIADKFKNQVELTKGAISILIRKPSSLCPLKKT